MPDPLCPSRQEMESRRLAAARALLDGVRPADIHRLFGVSRMSAARWTKDLRESGLDSLHGRRPPGRPCRLDANQQAELVAIWRRGPHRAGFAADRWTCELFALAIEERFRIRYDPDHVGRVILRLGLREKSYARSIAQQRSRRRAEVRNV